jgi:Sulfatase-modifying factor enzyme 1
MRDYGFDSLVPRPIDLPTEVLLGEVDLATLDDAKIFAAPSDPAQWSAWRDTLAAWRDDARSRLAYTGANYERPDARWASRCFAVAQVWLWDELLYDAQNHRFTPDRLLDDARDRLGGFDGVVLWHAYPVIGIDDRNQWDFYRDVPGLADLVDAFHERGVKVFVDYNPWDTGTRRGRDDLTELAALVRDLKADGVFLDTLKEADLTLASTLDEARPGIALEGESKLPLPRVADHSLSWAQWFADSDVPGVLRAHWFERRHMQHHIRRWNRDHSSELQSAWINSVGLMVWEVVFGVWVGWNPRDAATLRRMLPVQRALAEVLLEGDWTPLAPLDETAHTAGVYASRFEHDGVTAWTLVNRGGSAWTGPVLTDGDLDAMSEYVDLTGDGVAVRGQAPSVTVPARGIAGLLRIADGARRPGGLDEAIGLAHAASTDTDSQFPHRRAVRRGPAGAIATAGAAAPASGARPLPDVVRVPAGERVLTVRFRGRETGMYDAAPYVEEWKPLPPRLHDQRTLERVVDLPGAVSVQSREVSNSDFAVFLDATGYRPSTTARYLEHWIDGRPAPDALDQPVAWVDLDDARAYAAWLGGRLPTEDEWQIAAQEWPADFARLAPEVWNWTESEHTDGRSRFVMLKGGSAYGAQGSEWYFDGGMRGPDFSAKYLMAGFGLARSASIGFRCAWDSVDVAERATTSHDAEER